MRHTYKSSIFFLTKTLYFDAHSFVNKTVDISLQYILRLFQIEFNRIVNDFTDVKRSNLQWIKKIVIKVSNLIIKSDELDAVSDWDVLPSVRDHTRKSYKSFAMFVLLQPKKNEAKNNNQEFKVVRTLLTQNA